MQRYLSVDLLRGIAILLMIQVHFSDDLSYSEEPWAWLYKTSTILGMIPAPLFTFISGLSFSLWARKLQAKGALESDITRIALKRGVFLFVVGLVFNFAVWLPEETFNWDILTLLGVSLMVLPFVRKLPLEVTGLICLLVLLLTPPLRVMGEYPDYWEDGAFVYDAEFRDVALGFFVNGYFPVFPWLICPLVGYMIGESSFFRARPSVRTCACLSGIAVAAIAVAACMSCLSSMLPGVIARLYADGFSMYPASAAYLIATLGLSVFCLAVLRRWWDADPNRKTGMVIAWLQLWSAYSLTVYIVHQVIHLWPLWIYGIWQGQEDPTHYWREAMSTPVALGLALVFVILFTPVLFWLDRHRQFSLEWIMRRACG